MFPVMSFFSCSKFSVRDYNTSNIRDQLIENTTIVNVDVILSVLNDVVRVLISDCYSLCLRFVCTKVTKITRYMDVRFGRSFFGVFFQGVTAVS